MECGVRGQYMNGADLHGALLAWFHHIPLTFSQPLFHIRYLVLERKASVNRATKTGCTPLHLCCKTGHPNITKFLAIKCKANVSAVDWHNYTPLHCACEAGCTESVKCLLCLMPNEFFAKNTIPLDKIAHANQHRDVATIVDFHRKLKPSVGVI